MHTLIDITGDPMWHIDPLDAYHQEEADFILRRVRIITAVKFREFGERPTVPVIRCFPRKHFSPVVIDAQSITLNTNLPE